MKVTNYDLRPNRTVKLRRMEQTAATGMLALEHRASEEAVAVLPDSIKVKPQVIVLASWQDLQTLPPPYSQEPKRLGSLAFLTGDNPFLMVTTGGGCLPMPDDPVKGYSYQDVLLVYTRASQAALRTRGFRRARKAAWGGGTIVQIVLAGVCAVSAVIVAVLLLPNILEQFS